MTTKPVLLKIFGRHRSAPLTETFLTVGSTARREPSWPVLLGELHIIEAIVKSMIPVMEALRKKYWHDGTKGPRIPRSAFAVPRWDGTFPSLPHEYSVIRFTPRKDFDLKKLSRTLREAGIDAAFIESFCKAYKEERFDRDYLNEQIRPNKKFGNKIFWRRWFDILFSRCSGNSLLSLMAGGKPRKIEAIKRQKMFAGKNWSGATISGNDAATLTAYIAEEVFGNSPYTRDSLATKIIPAYLKKSKGVVLTF